MGTVDLDGVEAKPLGVRRGLAEGGDGVEDVCLAHVDAAGLARNDETGRSLESAIGSQPDVCSRVTPMCQISSAIAPPAVDSSITTLPAGERRFSVEVRHVGVVRGGGPTHDSPLGNDQADLPGAPPVIRRNLGMGTPGGANERVIAAMTMRFLG